MAINSGRGFTTGRVTMYGPGRTPYGDYIVRDPKSGNLRLENENEKEDRKQRSSTSQQRTTQGLATRREELSQMGGADVFYSPRGGSQTRFNVRGQPGWYSTGDAGAIEAARSGGRLVTVGEAGGQGQALGLTPALQQAKQSIQGAQDPGLGVTPGTTPSIAPIQARREELQTPWYQDIVAGQRGTAEAMPGFQTFGQETPWYKSDVAARQQKIGAMPGFQTFEEKAPWYQEAMAGQRADIGDYGVMESLEEKTPWYREGKGGGVLGRRRTEVEGIDPGEMYAMSAPSVRQTTDQIMASLKEDAARTGGSPSMIALMRKQDFGLAGLGEAAGHAASTAYSLKQQGLADLATMEASMGTTEMGARRAMSADRQRLLANLGTLEAQLGTAEMSERRTLQREKDRMLEDLFAMESGLGQTEMAARRAQQAVKDAALLDVGLMEASLETTRQGSLQELTQWEATLTATEMEARRGWESDLFDSLIDLAKLETEKEAADADRRQKLELEKQRLLSDITGFEVALSQNLTTQQSANYRARLGVVMQRERLRREEDIANQLNEALGKIAKELPEEK